MIEKNDEKALFVKELTPLLYRWSFLKKRDSRSVLKKVISDDFFLTDDTLKKPDFLFRTPLKDLKAEEQENEMKNLLDATYVQQKMNEMCFQIGTFEKYFLDLLKSSFGQNGIKKIKNVSDAFFQYKNAVKQLEFLENDAFLASVFQKEGFAFSNEFAEALLRMKKAKESLYFCLNDEMHFEEDGSECAFRNYILNAPRLTVSSAKKDTDANVVVTDEDLYSLEKYEESDFYILRYSNKIYKLYQALARNSFSNSLVCMNDKNTIFPKELLQQLKMLFNQFFIIHRNILANHLWKSSFIEEQELIKNVLDCWVLFSSQICSSDKQKPLWNQFIQSICDFDEDKINIYWSKLRQNSKNPDLDFSFYAFKECLVKKEVALAYYPFKNFPLQKKEFLKIASKITQIEYNHLRSLLKFLLKSVLLEIPELMQINFLKSAMKEVYFSLKREQKQTLKNMVRIWVSQIEKENAFLLLCRKNEKAFEYQKGDFNNSLLHKAILTDDVDLFKQRIKKKDELNFANQKGETPFILAAKLHKVSFVKKLMKKKIDLNASDFLGQTALHYLVELENLKLIEALVENGADINSVNYRNETPLYLSIQKDCVKSAQLLLDLGADVTLGDCNKKLPIHLAFQKGKKVIIDKLIEKYNHLNYLDSDFKNCFHYATFSGMDLYFEPLLKKGVNINAQDRLGRTPLHFATCYANIDIVSELIRLGADVNVQDKNLQTPLHLASAVGTVKNVKILISNGALVDKKDKFGQTSLYLAVLNEQTKVVKELFLKKANPYILTEKGLSAAMLIKNGTHRGFKTFLKEYETDFAFYYSVLQVAILKNDIEFVKNILEKQDVVEKLKQNSSLLFETALFVENYTVLHLLLKNGLKFDGLIKENMGQSALNKAVCKSDVGQLKFLISLGADVNSQDKGTGHSFLQKAVLTADLNVVKLLIESGADVFHKDNQGHDALWWARHLKLDLIEKELSRF